MRYAAALVVIAVLVLCVTCNGISDVVGPPPFDHEGRFTAHFDIRHDGCLFLSASDFLFPGSGIEFTHQGGRDWTMFDGCETRSGKGNNPIRFETATSTASTPGCRLTVVTVLSFEFISDDQYTGGWVVQESTDCGFGPVLDCISDGTLVGDRDPNAVLGCGAP